jgi:endonuclease/exonuclease/phosphatase family metal-dependent hydrolase
VKLKVVSYNICHGLGIDGRQDLERTTDVLRNSGADVIGLQEVDKYYGERSGWQDQSALLARSLGMHAAYGPNLDMDPQPGSGGHRRQYGIAILSRYPIVSSRNHVLPRIDTPGGWNEPRGLLEAHLQVRSETVRVLNTHLGLSKQERTAQALRLVEVYLADGPERCIVTGDFNALPNSPELAPLLAVLRDTYASVHGGRHDPTFLSAAGGAPVAVKCIDYIWCSPDLVPVDAAVTASLASDHLPLAASVIIGGPAH